MSFSNQGSSTPSPVSKYYEFKSGEKAFMYYDKEKGENVPMPLPAHLVVLDSLGSISGYSEANECGIYSNEVHSSKKETLTVKTYKGGVNITGFYQDIKGDLPRGYKFAKNLYCMQVTKEGTELVRIQLMGAALNAWIYFEKEVDTRKSIIEIKDEFKYDCKKSKAGKVITEWNVPTFFAYEITDDVTEKAIETDKALQAYFDKKNAPSEETVEETQEELPEEVEAEEPKEDLPF